MVVSDKRKIRKNIKRLKFIKTWQLVVLLVLMGFVSATFLRLNNIGMSQRRESVLAADKDGDESVIEGRLYELQQYTSKHMNSDTGPFYLENQYKRESQAILDKAKKYSNPNGNVHVKADNVCKPQYAAWSPAYVQCFANELAKYPAASEPEENVTLPSANLYRYSFSGPLWSADFAGLSLLVCLLIFLVIIFRAISLAVLYVLLKKHYRGI